jgi:outer membrane protein assembly factor BamD (BamD/ComL family)
MKGFTRIMLIPALLLGLAACSSSGNTDIDKINEAEEQLFSSEDAFINREKALQLVDMYLDFADKNPGDSMAVEYLYNGAEFYMNMAEGRKAVELYDRIIREYPDFRKGPECLFLKGYVYENYLGELEIAEAIYLEFLEKYPDSEFADDAEISIANLGKSPEELIRMFEEQQIMNDPE